MTVTAIEENFSIVISRLIELKSKRDNIRFSTYKLAQAIGVDRSIIRRIINGEIENPRLDTFLKIINFFIADGFRLNLEDIFPWTAKIIEVNSQSVKEESSIMLPLYQMDNIEGEQVGTTNIISTPLPSSAIAIISTNDISPIFKSESIFIVDFMAEPKNENMVMVKINNQPDLLLKQFIINNGNHILRSYSGEDDIIIGKNSQIKIVGIVVRINIKT
jgi:transcriptional regulator with XRE-family HTH domain